MNAKTHRLALAMIVLSLGGCATKPASEPTEVGMVEEEQWREQVEAWHAGRIERLRQPEGWLSLVALEWLEPGANLVGAGADAAIALPAGSAPDRVGVLTLGAADGDDGAKVTLVPEPGVEIAIDGVPVVGEVELVTDAAGVPTVMSIGSLRATVIARGEHFALRVKDTQAPLLSSFEGIDRFPLDPTWRIVAQFEPYDPPKMLAVPTALGTIEEIPSPGAVVFERDGHRVRIDAQPGGDEGTLFLVFGDSTNNKTTYGGGRFVYSEVPVDGTVVVDFNLAYNPPCVFTPYATCPLPTSEARLGFPIEVGEKNWGSAQH